MKILWLTWKDRKHPLAGGAEVVNEELAKRLAADGHDVQFLVGGYEGCKAEESINGYKVRRFVPRTSVMWWPLRCWQMFRYYRKHLQNWPDLVIDEVNTMPFFAKFYAKQPNILFVHMLCRKIWFYQFPFPLNVIGYLLEPVYLWPLRKQKVITISKSTKKDLMVLGFNPNNINIISEGIQMDPIKDPETVKKFDNPTLLSLGSIRAMKNTVDQIKAFEHVKVEVKDAKLKVAGDASGTYGQKVLKKIKNSRYTEDIEFLGKVNDEEKKELLQKCHLLMVTSVKEGWGLVVTEAASQGTPAVVYDVDGLRDSVTHGETGLICSRNTPNQLAKNIAVLLNDRERYNTIRDNAWGWSEGITFEQSYHDFMSVINP